MKVAAPRTTTWVIPMVLTAAFTIHVSEGGAGAEAQGGVAEEMRLLKEETVSIAARHEQPISQSPSNVYVITDSEIRRWRIWNYHGICNRGGHCREIRVPTICWQRSKQSMAGSRCTRISFP